MIILAVKDVVETDQVSTKYVKNIYEKKLNYLLVLLPLRWLLFIL
jgi:hypothetical protein